MNNFEDGQRNYAFYFLLFNIFFLLRPEPEYPSPGSCGSEVHTHPPDGQEPPCEGTDTTRGNPRDF